MFKKVYFKNNKVTNLKLAFIAEAFMIMKGGGERWLYNVAKRLAEMGYTIEIYSIDTIREYKGHNFWVKKLSPIPLYNFNSYSARALLITIGIVFRLKKILKNNIIIISQTFPLLFIPLLKLKHIKVHAIYGNYYGLEYSIREKGLKGLLRALIELLANKIVGKMADSAIVVAKYIALGIETQGVARNKIHTVYCGVNLDIIRRIKVKKSRTPLFIFIGRLVDQKRPWLAIEAFEKLIKKGIEAKLVIAGDGPLKNRLKRMIKEMNLNKNIEILGRISEYQKYKLLKQAWALILPSGTEGLPITLLEAMASKTPPIAARVGGIPELIEHGKDGFLFDPNKPQEINNYIEKLLQEDLIEKMGKWGERKVKSMYTWNHVVTRVNNALLANK